MDPNASFDDEILAINPDCDLIFKNYEVVQPRPPPHPLEGGRRICSPRKMKIISKMNQIIGIKPIGELPTENDWEDTESTEKETIALMRKLGLEPSIDRQPDESRTISTMPVQEDVIFMRNGKKKMSIFMSNSFFELKPRSEPTFCTEEDGEETSTSQEVSTSEYSDDVNLYEPIPTKANVSAKEKEVNEVHRDQEKILEESNSSWDSHNCRLDGDNAEPSWRRQGPLREDSQEKRNGGYCNQKNNWRGRSSASSSGTGSSNSSWRQSNESSCESRDENNWRINARIPTVSEKSKEPLLDKKNDEEEKNFAPKPVSNCGSPLFRPKELFMKKKAMMIQQVFAEHNS